MNIFLISPQKCVVGTHRGASNEYPQHIFFGMGWSLTSLSTLLRSCRADQFSLTAFFLGRLSPLSS